MFYLSNSIEKNCLQTQAKESEKSREKYTSKEQPKPSKHDEKNKNVEEREDVIDHSVVGKIQNINEREPVIKIHSENLAKSKDATDKTEIEKARNSVSVAGYGIENLPKGWDRKIIIRKTGKTAGQVDIYFFRQDKLFVKLIKYNLTF